MIRWKLYNIKSGKVTDELKDLSCRKHVNLAQGCGTIFNKILCFNKIERASEVDFPEKSDGNTTFSCVWPNAISVAK